MIAGLRSVDRDYADPIDPRPTRGETVNFRDRPDARVGLSGRLDPEHAVVLRAALDAVRAADTAEAGPDEEPMSTAGALVRMAELVLGLLAERGEDLPVRREDQDTTIVVHLHAVPSSEPAAQDPVPHDRNGSREPRDWRLVPETALAAARLQDQNGSREPHSTRLRQPFAAERAVGPAHRTQRRTCRCCRAARTGRGTVGVLSAGEGRGPRL